MENSVPYSVKIRFVELVEQGTSVSRIASLFNISRKTVHKWLARYESDGEAGLKDISRRPHHSPNRLSDALIRQIIALRRKERIGPQRIALRLGLSHASVYRTLCRHGMAYLRPKKPRIIRRYEKDYPGELMHLDIKKLVPLRRGTSPEHQFAVLDDFSREVYSRIYPVATTKAATDFLLNSLGYYQYPVRAVLTDNAFCFTMRHALHAERTTLFARTCDHLGIKHHLLRPYHPETNGKVERFFRTVDEECYDRVRLRNSEHRSRILEHFVWYYNNERAHLSLSGLTPVQRRIKYFASVTDVLR
jgi:transposase InsO family protein